MATPSLFTSLVLLFVVFSLSVKLQSGVAHDESTALERPVESHNNLSTGGDEDITTVHPNSSSPRTASQLQCKLRTGLLLPPYCGNALQHGARSSNNSDDDEHDFKEEEKACRMLALMEKKSVKRLRNKCIKHRQQRKQQQCQHQQKLFNALSSSTAVSNDVEELDMLPSEWHSFDDVYNDKDDDKDIFHSRSHALHTSTKTNKQSRRQTSLTKLNGILIATHSRQSSSVKTTTKQVHDQAPKMQPIRRVGWKSPGVTGLAIVPDLSEYYDYETALEYGLFGTLDDVHNCDGACAVE